MPTAILLPLGLAFIMFAIGLGLTTRDFTRILRKPGAMGAGLFNQLVLLPMIGAGLVMIYGGRPEFAVGIMILAACPGGITSNLLTLLAGGNAALSVSMTALSSLASIFTVPLILGLTQFYLLGESQPVSMPVGKIMAGILVITGLPILLGMGLQRWRPAWADALRPRARQLATILFAFIVAGAFVGQKDNIVLHFLDLGPYVLVLNLATMCLGLCVARLLDLSREDGIAICLESGLQNAALAIFVATTLLGSPPMLVPAIIYALVMNLSAGAFIFWARGRALPQTS